MADDVPTALTDDQSADRPAARNLGAASCAPRLGGAACTRRQ
jgi:hypothetical protein